MSLLSDTLKSIQNNKDGVSSRKPKKLKKKVKEVTEIERPIRKKKKKYVASPLIIVKKDLADGLDDQKVKDWLATKPGLLEGLTTTNGTPTKLYDYQIAHLNNESRFRICNKARQIGWSFACNSGEALAKSHLVDINTSIFISYNKDEASEKILHVQALYESMPLAYQKKRIVDNKHSQTFVNAKGNTTRIISTAQRPPRGKGYNTDIYLDEFAFYQWPDKIYTASVPVITRGNNGPNKNEGGVITIGSTPLGAKGKFHDILTHQSAFPNFSRQYVPWWHCPILCNDIVRAYKDAPGMTTEERVYTFGDGIIPIMFTSMPVDDFQQEYELAFIDENVSYFPFQIVDACTYGTETDEENYDEIVDKKGLSVTIAKNEKSSIEVKYNQVKFFCCKSIEELQWKVNNGEISTNLFAGYDVGRRKDKSELTVIEEIEIGSGLILQIIRFTHQLALEKFEVQKEYLRSLLKNIPIKKCAIDAMGIGMNLAENLATEFPGIVEELAIEGEWKERVTQSMKIRFENQLIAIPDDENLKKQIRSIKKKVSDIGTVRYDAEKDKDHHGDKFWSLALASYAGTDTAMMNISSLIIASGSRLMSLLPTNNKKKSIEGQNTLAIVNQDDMSFSMPGFGNIPSPITNLLMPGDFIDGSATWLNGSHTLIRKR